jgi:hypothetical protein
LPLYSSYLLNMPNLCRLNEKKRSVYTIHIYKPHVETNSISKSIKKKLWATSL